MSENELLCIGYILFYKINSEKNYKLEKKFAKNFELEFHIDVFNYYNHLCDNLNNPNIYNYLKSSNVKRSIIYC